MSCTPPQYLLSNHGIWTSAASPIITIAPVIHRNHLHILSGKVAASSEEQNVGRSTILTGFAMQGYSLRPRPSNDGVLEQAGPARQSYHSHVDHLMTIRRPELLQASILISCLHQ